MNHTPDDPTDAAVEAFLDTWDDEPDPPQRDPDVIRRCLTAALAVANRDRCPHPAGHDDQVPACPVTAGPCPGNADGILCTTACGPAPSVRSAKPGAKLPAYPASEYLRAPAPTACPQCGRANGHDPWCANPGNPLRA